MTAARRRRLDTARLAAAGGLAAVALGLPLAGTPYIVDVGTLILVYVMLGLGLNIVVGYAGLLDLGYAAFFAIAAYTTAIMMVRFHTGYWVTIPAAALLTTAAGAVIGTPTLRMRSDYLAIVTLGFGEIVRITATNLSFTGGPDGVWGIPRPAIGALVLGTGRALYYLGLALVILVSAGARNLARSRMGRAWLAIREDELAARAAGINTVAYKLRAYMLGAMFGGVAGSFFAVKLTAIDPTSFTFVQSVNILMVVVLGGMGSLPGVVLGAAVIIGLPEALRAFQTVRMLAFGIGLIVLMLLRPQGLWPSSARARQRRTAAAPVPGPAAPAAGGAASGSSREGVSLIHAAPRANGDGDGTGRLLSVEHLAVRFGGLVAVNDLSFGVGQGEIVSLIGPNGAGKTTVFNCITGFQRPTAGRIVFRDATITGLRPDLIVRRGIARTFQLIRLFPNLPVDENVEIGLHPRIRSGTLDALLHTPRQRWEEAWVHDEARRWLDYVGLSPRAQQLARELAYGDQRRLEIARALAAAPRILILDEPASGMNPAEKDDLARLVGTIRDGGVTVLLIEHDMSVVMGVSDRVVVLNYGAQIAEGTPEEIQEHPAVIEAYLGREDDE